MQTSPVNKSPDYELGNLIQTYRYKAKLTQSGLAKLVGVSKRTVINWEAGTSYPQSGHLRRLVEIFLDRGCFTEQVEQGEAQFLWESATRAKNDAKDDFDPAWFNSLLRERTGLLRAVEPSTLFQKFPRQDWSDAVENRLFYGREAELAELEKWLVKDKQRVVGIFGIGGIGKTGLAISAARQVAPHFDFTIVRSLHNAPSLSELLDGMLRFFLDGQLNLLPALQSEKVALLMDYLRNYRCLVVLDNLESLMQEGLTAGEFRPGYTDYGDLLRRLCETAHQSCLLLTSREKPHHLGQREERNGFVKVLALKGLDKKSCQAILSTMNINCSAQTGLILAELYGGNPLALKLIAEPIRELYGGDTEAYLASPGFRSGEVRYLLDQHFDRLSEVEQDIMYWLAVSREPVELATIQQKSMLLRPGYQTFTDGLNALFKRFLLEHNEDKSAFTLQGVIADYVTERLVNLLLAEITGNRPALLCRYPLLQTQAREYIQQAQLRLLLDPLLAQLRATLKRDRLLINRIEQVLENLRKWPVLQQAYAGGNLLNLLVRLGADLSGLPLEELALWQAGLVGVALPGVNMRGADLSGATFTEANVSACCLAYSPDGQTVAIGCVNGAVKLWQTGRTFGNQLLECQGHTNLVGTVAFSPDGTLLASGSMDGTVRLWELQSGTCLANLSPGAGAGAGSGSPVVRAVAFSPDGKLLASAGDDRLIYIWQVATGQLVTTLAAEQGWVMSVAFSPDGKLLASGGFDASIKLWEVSGMPGSVKPVGRLVGHQQWVNMVVFSPDGAQLASGSADHTVRIWSVAYQRLVHNLGGHNGIVTAVAFSPDGQLLISSGVDHQINLYRLASQPVVPRSLPPGNGARMGVAFHPDGETFVSCSAEVATVELWSVKSLEVLDRLRGYSNLIYSIALSPDGKWLGAGGIDYNLALWSLTQPQTSQLQASQWQDTQPQTSQPLRNSQPLILKGHTGYISALAFGRDNQTVATCSSDATIKLWNLASSKCWRTLAGHKKRVVAVAFSPDNRLLISGDEEGNLKLWSLITGSTLTSQVAHQGRITKILFSPAGRLLATAAQDGFIKLWEVDPHATTLRQLATWSNQGELVMALAFNHDGSQLYSGGSDGLVRCWQVATGECLSQFKAHKGVCWAIEYSPGGSRLATAGEDGLVQVWQVVQPDRPELVTSLGHGSRAMALAFSPDGKRLFSAGEGGTVKQWRVEDSAQLASLTVPAPYEGLDITGVTGLTEAQRLNLLGLGAVETPV